jgi:hypothetical protein
MTYQLSMLHSITVEQSPSTDLVKLIRKLRWIGLEEEAHQLEMAVSRFPPEERAVVLANASSTD